MSYVTWKFEHTPYTSGNVWDDSQTAEITAFREPNLIVSLGDNRDSFSMKLTNFNNDWAGYFGPQDRIVISRVVSNTSTDTTDIIMTGAIQDVPQEIEGSRNDLSVKGFNYTEAVLSALVFIDATELDVSQALQAALNHVKVFNENFAVTWHPDNPSTKQDGSAFPTVGEKFFYRPLRDLFTKYSTNTGTQDGPYMWYVDSTNRLVWRPRTASVSFSFDSNVDTAKSIKPKKDIKEVKNFVIVKGGYDVEGNAIQTLVQDLPSQSRHGMRYHILTDYAKLGGTLIKQDTDAQGVTHLRSASFPFTSQWKSFVTGDYISASSLSDYNDKLRAHILVALKAVGTEFLTLRKYGKLEVELEFGAGEKSWSLGDVGTIDLPDINLTDKQLRITEIQYTNDADTYTLEEDLGSL